VRVEVGDHAADRGFDQFLIGDRFDVFLADVFQYFGQQARILPRHRSRLHWRDRRLDFQLRLHRAADRQAETHDDADPENQHKAKRHRDP
jgi:hypothetical protein